MYKTWKRILPPGLRHRLMIAWYDRLAQWGADGSLSFLNHGYAPPEGPSETLLLAPEDEANRYWIQLYHCLASHIDWQDARVLDVSCGPGGGSDWLARAFSPAHLLGIDIAPEAVALANRQFGRDGLLFQVGDAEKLPFPKDSFDIIINIESSLNYQNFDAFVKSVDRVLAPGGHFLIADYRNHRKRLLLDASLARLNYKTIWQADLTAGILRSHAFTRQAKTDLVETRVPRFLRGLVRRFADLDEEDTVSGLHRFTSGHRVYFGYVLKKPSTEVKNVILR